MCLNIAENAHFSITELSLYVRRETTGTPWKGDNSLSLSISLCFAFLLKYCSSPADMMLLGLLFSLTGEFLSR